MQPSPYFLIDPVALRRSMAEFKRAFPQSGLFYAVKANAEPFVLSTLASLDCGFEAASWGEIELLISLGVSPSRIIYGTAVKPRWHVARAAAAGIDCFAADSIEEIEMLAEAAPSSRAFIRVKADDSSAVFRLNRKFGASHEEAVPLLMSAASRGLVPWGLSFNVGSQVARASAWADAIASLTPVLAELLGRGVRLEAINIGGGFPEAYAGEKTCSLWEIGASISRSVACLPYAPQLVLEPGRRMVASSMSLFATVIARVERADSPWLFLDCGAYNALFEALRCQGTTRYEVHRHGAADRTSNRAFVLAGPTGDSLDVLSEAAELPADTAVGDRLRFERVGAYTLALASAFNGFPVPAVYVVGQV